MSGVGIVYRRELRHYVVTPIAGVLVAAFWAASGFFFSFNTVFVSAVDMVTAFHNMSLLLLLMMPFVSMRLFAEERNNGTLELLFALPLSETEIVLAKYLALMTIVAVMLAGSATAVGVLLFFAEPDLGPVYGGYCGVFLLAAAFSAIGMLASAATGSQVLAAVATWLALLGFWFVDYAAALVPGSALVPVLQHLSFSVQYLDLIRGIVDSAAVAYFLGVSAVCLALTVMLLNLTRR